jgi:hypothetical protein
VEEVNECAFLFGGESGADARLLVSGVVGVDEDLLDALCRLKGSGGSLGVWCLLRGFLPDDCKFLEGDDHRGELATFNLAPVGTLERGADSDDLMRAWHLELEVCAVGDGHELLVARLPQDGMVGSMKSDHLEGEGLRFVVGWIPECYGKFNLPE